jgi:hypothetical protein
LTTACVYPAGSLYKLSWRIEALKTSDLISYGVNGLQRTEHVSSQETTEPNTLIYLAYVAGVVLAVGLLVLAVGLIRRRQTPFAG